MVHTAKWEEILKLEKPADELKYPVAIWHYARGMAYGAKGDLQQSEKELQQIKTIAADTALKSAIIWGFNSAYDLVNIATYSLEAEIAFHKKQYSVAEELLKKAIEIEDSLHYTEPPDWFFSIRLSLGNVLLKAAKYADAENVYLEDLKTFPENGWALMGLFNSLKAQGKMQEAKAIKQRFDKAWQWSDLKITSSRIY
jgi:tetratricopeptide (TPR) repeat protein